MSQLATWPITTWFHPLVSPLAFNFYPTPVCNFCPTPVCHFCWLEIRLYFSICDFRFLQLPLLLAGDSIVFLNLWFQISFSAILICTPALAFHVIKAFHVIRKSAIRIGVLPVGSLPTVPPPFWQNVKPRFLFKYFITTFLMDWPSITMYQHNNHNEIFSTDWKNYCWWQKSLSLWIL